MEQQLRCATARGSTAWHGRAGIWGALLRAPISAWPAATGKVRALASHGQAGGFGRGAGGAAAGRGRGAGVEYWALRHAAAQPDFHARDTFVLTLATATHKAD